MDSKTTTTKLKTSFSPRSDRREANSWHSAYTELFNQVIDFPACLPTLEPMMGRIIEGRRTGALDPPLPGRVSRAKN